MNKSLNTPSTLTPESLETAITPRGDGGAGATTTVGTDCAIQGLDADAGQDATRPSSDTPGETKTRSRKPLLSTDTRKGAFSLMDQAVVSGTSFATAVIVGRFGSPETLGIYYLALSILLFARGIQSHVVSSPYLIYCGRRRGAALTSYSGSTLVHQLVLISAALVVLLGMLSALSSGIGPVTLGPAIWSLLLALPFLRLWDYVRHFSFAHLETGTAMVVDTAMGVLQVSGLLVLATFVGLSVAGVYGVMGGACGVVCVVYFIAKRRAFRFELRQIVPDWRHNWQFGKWALAGYVVSHASVLLMPWILLAAIGEAPTGALAASATLVGVANMFVIGVGNYLTPRAARSYLDEGASGLCRVLRNFGALFLLIIGSFCLVAVLAGEPLAVLIFGDKYVGLGNIISVLALGTLVNSVGMVAGNGLWALERPGANLVADIATSVVTVGGALLVIGSWGVLGAALAMLAGIVVGTILRYYTFVRMLNSDAVIAART